MLNISNWSSSHIRRPPYWRLPLVLFIFADVVSFSMVEASNLDSEAKLDWQLFRVYRTEWET
jgi:hypothetical protein